MLFGLMLISTLIANLHAAVFYVFFILLLPYFAEYLVILIKEANIEYKFRKTLINRNLKRLSKNGKAPEKLEKTQIQLDRLEENHTLYLERDKKRVENPYKIKLVKREAVKWLVLIAILCFCTGLLTPIGDEPYTHIFKLLSGTTTESISEHQPLILAGHIGAIVSLTMILVLLIFTDCKISLKDGFMLAGLIILTFSARRQFSLLLIIGGFSLCTLICDLINKYDKSGTDGFIKLMTTWKGKIIAIILIVLCSYFEYKDIIFNEYIDESSYPVGVANFMILESSHGNFDIENMRLYNDYNYGSYLLYRGIPVFIDSRADLYSKEFNEGCQIFDDYMNISNIAVYYEDKFDKYEITHVITYKKSKLNIFLSRDDDYFEIYSDKDFILYERLNVDAEQEF